MPNILIADDEREIVKLLKIYLETDGVTVLEANDGAQALDILENNEIDLAIVDIMMPEIDGYQVIKKIRQQEKYIPVMVISAKITLSDRVLGIDLGADDYITKPFEPLEVAAKVKAQLRRLNVSSPKSVTKNVVTVGDMELDLDECKFIKNGKDTELTKAEFKVLELLMSQPRRVFTKEQIYESAWYDDGAVDDNTIRVIISRLRDKVGAEHIKTIRGLGYRFET
ncbi:MAG: response regulator transcription factor [Oscillospiraceae bacterium]|nr:response regulator transcription factor [Oscillospiraceae bacterium]